MLEPAPEPQPFPIANPPRTALSHRAAALFEVVLCSGFPTQILLILLMAAAGMRLPSADGQWSATYVTMLSLLDTVLVVGLIVFFLKARRESVSDVLLGKRPISRETALGVALFPIVFMIAVVVLGTILRFAPQLHDVQRNPFEAMMQTRRDAIVFGVVAVIAGGVREEIQRGFILHRFSQFLGGGPVGVVVYSAVFGLGHRDQGWDTVIAVAILGAIWGTIYLIRRSIVASMVSHSAFNLAHVMMFRALH